ncbi:hypothetical protein KI688_003967 [Linnemannia hyalina]|uniref:Uncharacterized protein n=1 Tax=Linnemannia hyalina TaxID=64524 RepID=A0A9P7XM56_9FUNG|nr:hypothetical protein KI688_003967 [Linnemannia hyalina]
MSACCFLPWIPDITKDAPKELDSYAAGESEDTVNHQSTIKHDVDDCAQRIPKKLKVHAKAQNISYLEDDSLQSQEFLVSKHQVMLTLSDSIAGKSTFNRHPQHQLWADYKQGGLILLCINLLFIDNPTHDLIEMQLQCHNYSGDQIQAMKSEFLGPVYLDRFVPEPEDDYKTAWSDLFQEAIIARFSNSQVEDFMRMLRIPNFVDVMNPFS